MAENSSDAAEQIVRQVASSCVHRLTFGGNIIETGSDSYRLAHTKARQQTSAGS